MTMRTLEQITTDEILDAIATFGVHGAPLDERLLTRILGEPNDRQQRNHARHLASELLWEARDGFRYKPQLFNNTYVSPYANRICLDESEWARRLYSKSAGEIEALLRGKQ